jgi:putative toxin-antitoxin system antitoxin component (TIGR02293 family)
MKEPKIFDISSLPYELSESDSVLNFLLPEPSAFYQRTPPSTENAIDKIRDGLPKQAIDTVLAKTNISRTQLSNILHISTRQLNRYEKDERLSIEQSNFLYEFTRIYTRGLDILGDAATIDAWLARPNMALGEISPIELLDTGEGARMVNDLLSNIEYGFYS